MLYGTVFTMARRKVDGSFELFILDRKDIILKELQNEQIIRR